MAQIGQGGNITLRVQYLDGGGYLTDPTSPLLSILDPDGTVVATGLVPTRSSVGEFYYIFAVPTDAPLGEWTGRFTGSINGVSVTGDEPFTVVSAGSVIPAEDQTLASLEELKIALGMPIGDEYKDVQLRQALEGATAAVLAWTDRDFFNGPTEVRTFYYDGEGYLEIDDATEVLSISIDGRALQPEEWSAEPAGEPVKHWLMLNYGYPFGSPAMGFERNLDRFPRRLPKQTPIEVEANWGWPYIPADVRQATIWTAVSMYENPSPYISESIEGYSRTIGAAPRDAVPSRAMQLLNHYIKVRV